MISIFFKKTWDILRPYLVPLTAVFFAFLGARHFLNQFKDDRDGFAERMKEMQAVHDKEMSKIMTAQAEERNRHEQNLRQLEQGLNDAVAKHEEKLKELEHQKELESKRLFEKYRNDPVGLAQEMSRVTGIPVYIQGEKK